MAEYVRLITDQALTMGILLSGRRVSMMYRNAIAVHAARLVEFPAALASDSAWMAFEHSLPQRAEGATIERGRLLLAHNNAWAVARMVRSDPRRALISEQSPVRRAIRALGLDSLSGIELSAYLADGLAEAPPGGRHALAMFALSSPGASRLNAAVAEQAAELSVIPTVAQSVSQSVESSSAKHRAWVEIEKVIASLPAQHPETVMITNLLAGLFIKGTIATQADVSPVRESWRSVRSMCQDRRLTIAPCQTNDELTAA